MPFSFTRSAIPDVLIIEPEACADERGVFLGTFRAKEFTRAGIGHQFVQDNHSRSKRAALRGLHFQVPPFEQGKLVRVSRGTVLDVAVDLREGSPWYGQHVAVELSDDNHRILWVPPGFGHGFCTMTSEADVMYKVTKEYNTGAESGIHYADPDLGIDWLFDDDELLVPSKDRRLGKIESFQSPFRWEKEK
jgi:dTDP-4-dehydrorhamnose 3,5-epimerase